MNTNSEFQLKQEDAAKLGQRLMDDAKEAMLALRDKYPGLKMIFVSEVPFDAGSVPITMTGEPMSAPTFIRILSSTIALHAARQEAAGSRIARG